MSEDPISKSQLTPRAKSNFIPLSKGRNGKIFTDKDYSSSFKSLPSRVIFVFFCAVPYIVIATYLYFTADEVIAIIMLALPAIIGLAFWFLMKNIES